MSFSFFPKLFEKKQRNAASCISDTHSWCCGSECFYTAHCSAPLQLDNNLNTIAQNYADYLAARNIFQHSNNGYGENLYMTSSSAPIQSLSGTGATQAWYDEIDYYNFNSPGFSSSTGHFTQVVWKTSTKLGVGIAFSLDGRRAYVVANYDPPGNYMGQFAQQVGRPGC
ncbi:unnamed protein product [Rotaria socialis]|uniref:SCP domain-containing protein n=1 Tax=Rotaria socialis TaxID=392032 RepID=A0A818IZI2_9BILA|nr:unnamed protein product [Rotaria socialis]